MIKHRVLQLLFLVSSMTFQVIGMLPTEKVFQVEGIAQRIEELPKELKYKILSSALALRENPKYEVYRKLDVGSLIRGIALNADNTRALTGSKDGVARIWDVEKGTVLKELKGHTSLITSIALSADDTLALTGSWDGTARVWNMNTGETIRIFEVGSHVRSVALSTDGTLALTGGHDSIVRLYNTSTGELLKELKGHKDRILSVALSADGTLALTSSHDGTARVWNINTGEPIRIIEVGSSVRSVALSVDGAIALTGTNKNAQVWDVKTGALLKTTDDIAVYAVALSNDGKRALVGTDDDTIWVWNTRPLSGQKETNTPLTVLADHTDIIRAVAFGNADFIASCSYDTTALIWKPYALEPQDPQENKEVLRQAYKETFSRPKFLFPDETKQA